MPVTVNKNTWYDFEKFKLLNGYKYWVYFPKTQKIFLALVISNKLTLEVNGRQSKANYSQPSHIMLYFPGDSKPKPPEAK